MEEKTEYILFTQEGLYKMLMELEITIGSRMNSVMSDGAIRTKIDENKVPFTAIQVWTPDWYDKLLSRGVKNE